MPNQQNKDIPIEYIMQDEYEIDETKTYKLEDLYLGMRVHTGQLRDIYYTYILVANPILVNIDRYTVEYAGTIVFIGKEQNKDLLEAWNKYTINNCRPCKIYNEQDVSLEEFVYQPDGSDDLEDTDEHKQ